MDKDAITLGKEDPEKPCPNQSHGLQSGGSYEHQGIQNERIGMTKQSNTRKSKAICSFCGRSGNQADTLIEGPDDVFICPECVELCHNIIKQNRRQADGHRLNARQTSKSSAGEI